MKILCYGIYRDLPFVYLKYTYIDHHDLNFQYLRFTKCTSLKVPEAVESSFCFIENFSNLIPERAEFSYEKVPFECDLSYVEGKENTCLYNVQFGGYELKISEIRVGFFGTEYYKEGNSYFTAFLDSYLIHSLLKIHSDYIEELFKNDLELTAK
jgi:hypothetical protein